MNSMKNMTVEEFNAELASNSPAPGGGTVAALTGALSSALSSMVFSLTVGKKIYNEYDKSTKDKIDEAQLVANELKNRFLELMDEDTRAFNGLMAAFKMPKETDEEKKVRSGKIQEGYIEATKTPLATAKEAYKIFDLLHLAAEYGNPNAVSDAGVGAILALASIEGAILNVRINLGSIKNKEIVDKISKECEELLALSKQRRDDIMSIVNSKL